MDKSVIGLVAAMGAAAPFAAAHAETVSSEEAANALRVNSVAELLDPAPNAVAVLSRLDQDRKTSTPDVGVQLAQWHHHHHHHHHWYHHHHHHHHHWYWHHHHHHHWRWCWHHHHWGRCFW